MNPLTVHKSITLHSPIEKIWMILVLPKYIKQWNDVPEDFSDSVLQLGSELKWERKNGEFTKLKVIDFVRNEFLQFSLENSTWKEKLKPEDITYTYSIHGHNDHSHMDIIIGDFSKLEDGQKYYDEALEFAEKVSAKIKQLAE